MFLKLSCPQCRGVNAIVKVEKVRERRTYLAYRSGLEPTHLGLDNPSVEVLEADQSYFMCEICSWTLQSESTSELLACLDAGQCSPVSDGSLAVATM